MTTPVTDERLRTPVSTDPRNRFEIIDAQGFSVGSGTTPHNTDAIVAACNAYYGDASRRAADAQTTRCVECGQLTKGTP